MSDYSDKTLLILGGSIEALPVIEYAKGLGLRLVVMDACEQAPGFALADESLVANINNIVESAEVAKKSSEDLSIDGVMSAAAGIPYTVSYVAKELGLSSIGVESAKYSMDKLLMKGLFRDAGVPIGRFSTVNSFDHLERILPEITTSVVIKPTDSSGAKGLVRLERGIEPLRAYEEAVKASPTGTCMVEEWLEGVQISTESVLTQEGISTPGLILRNYDRLEEFFPYVIEDGGDMPADLTPAVREEIDNVIKRAANALNITRGIIKGDIILTQDGPLIVEIEPGLAPGLFTTHLGAFSEKSIIKAAIDFALNLDVEFSDYRVDLDQFFSKRLLFPEPGTVKEVRVDESLKGDGRIAFFDISVKPGDTLSRAVSLDCSAATVIASAKSEDEALEAALEALRRIEIIYV